MSPPTEITPLQGTSQVRPALPPIRCILFYGFFLGLFLFCNVLPFIPEAFYPKAFLPDDFAKLQNCMLVAVDYVVAISWSFLKRVVEYAGSEATRRQAEPSQRRAIRKSESVNALIKALLKILPIISTIHLASKRLGRIFIPIAAGYFTITALFTYGFLVPSARVVLSRKAERDDAL